MKKLTLSIALSTALTGYAVAETPQEDRPTGVNATTAASGYAPDRTKMMSRGAEGMSPAQLDDMEVVNRQGEELGEVDDIVEDPATGIRHAVIEVGGFLGIGEKEVLVPLADLEPATDKANLIADYTPDQLKGLPDFEEVEDRYIEIEEEEAE